MKNPMSYLTRVLRRVSNTITGNAPKKVDRHELVVGGLFPNHAFLDMGVDKDYLKAMLEDCYEVLQEYLNGDRYSLEGLLRDRTYIFVTGSPRTGGAYTTHNLRRILCRYRDKDPVVRNESIPGFYNLFHSEDLPCRNQALFELIQWQYWIDHNYREHNVIVKKCTGFSYAMNLVGDFFGDKQVKFIITTRHPAPIWRSAEEAMIRLKQPGPVIPVDSSSYLFKDREPPQWWLQESENLRALYAWHRLYSQLVETLPVGYEDRINVVQYGHQENVLIEVVRQVDSSRIGRMKELIEQDPFRLTQRTYSGFWYTDIVGAVIDSTKAQWGRRGLYLPVDHRRIE